MKMKFRDLTEDEIEVRVHSVNQNGVVLLLYKNARCDMNILDETVGASNWQREHYECKGNLFCRVGINVNFEIMDAPDVVVWKSDCGVESREDAQKGEASDSFKRACVNWGIGRELYTAPFIFVKADDCKHIFDKNEKKVCYDKFCVEKIRIENKRITGLAIRNTTTGKRVFIYEEKKEARE